MNRAAREFLDAKVRGLAARARRLSSLDHRAVGIRPEDVPYTPSPAHFAAANARLAEIDKDVKRQLAKLAEEARSPHVTADIVLRHAALVEREVDRARRAYSLFFEVLGQRGSRFAPALAACDAIAADCFRVVRVSAPGILRGPLLRPVTYLEFGFSPATFRRGVVLSRLLGETNPFPLVRVPYERVEAPWGFGVVLHEIGHNLQSDMGIWQENRRALQRRVLQASGDPSLTRIWGRWHKEIFADLIALLLGGPASARSMMDFLSYPSTRVVTFRPMSVHPTSYLRTFVMTEMLDRMGFTKEAARGRDVWKSLYGAAAETKGAARMPKGLLATAPRIIPQVVDEIAFQTRRGLGSRALVDVVPFTRESQRQILSAARDLSRGVVPASLPPRFVVSASRYAFDDHLAPARDLARTVLQHLARTGARSRARATTTRIRAAA